MLGRGLQSLGLANHPGLEQQLLSYLDLLQRWNRVYNLTAVRDPEQMVLRHLLDCLAVAPHLATGERRAENRAGERMADVGSGAGLPGAILAMVYPQRQFSLLDSRGKKTRFLQQVKTELALANITVLQTRVEDYRPARKYDVVLSRGFSPLPRMVAVCGHLLRPGGRFLAMKGTRPRGELAQLPEAVEVLAVHELRVPGLSERRHLVELRR